MKNKWIEILRNGRYALLQSTTDTQYVVASGYNPEKKEGCRWKYGEYFVYWHDTKQKAKCLKNALDLYMKKTENICIKHNTNQETENVMKIFNIKEFLAQFEKEYDFLYKNGTVAGEDEAAQSFDKFAETHKEFMTEFVKYRGDFISSDREAAAFMFALQEMEE